MGKMFQDYVDEKVEQVLTVEKLKKAREKHVMETLRRLGLTSRYSGYRYLIDATIIHMKYVYFEKRPVMITKDIYPEVAKKHKTTPQRVERAIRHVIEICFEKNKELLSEMGDFQFEKRPTNSEFLDIIAYYLYTSNTKK